MSNITSASANSSVPTTADGAQAPLVVTDSIPGADVRCVDRGARPGGRGPFRGAPALTLSGLLHEAIGNLGEES